MREVLRFRRIITQVEREHPFFDLSVRFGNRFMLAQVLTPRLDDESLDETT